jgi:hypothetical protein
LGFCFGRGNGDDFVLGVVLFSSGFGLQHGGFLGGDGECIFNGAVVSMDESREITQGGCDRMGWKKFDGNLSVACLAIVVG